MNPYQEVHRHCLETLRAIGKIDGPYDGSSAGWRELNHMTELIMLVGNWAEQCAEAHARRKDFVSAVRDYNARQSGPPQKAPEDTDRHNPV